MKVSYKIIWSDESVKNLDSIIKYLELNWTEKEVKKFLNALSKRIQLISLNPLILRSTPKSKNIRKSVLSNQASIFYRITEYRIEILSIFDNRQNPDKLKI
jgi:plasmid stabilization system protein ParE